MPICRTFLHRSDLSFKLLRDSTSYFGFNPRPCFEASSSAKTLKGDVDNLEDKIKEAAKTWDIMELLQGARTGGTERGLSNVSHAVFQIFPPDTDKDQELRKCHFEAVSRWAFDTFLKEYEAREANEVSDFYFKLSGMRGAESLRDHIFERQVLNHLRVIDDPLEFSIRGLTNSHEMKWTYYGRTRHVTLQESTFSTELTKAVRNQERLHLVPLARNFSSIDSILFDPKDPKAVFTCIQITRSMGHSIAISGLRLIESWLKLNTPLSDLRPSEKSPWRFVFVVPSGHVDNFQIQLIVNDSRSGQKGVANWPKKVQQFVLGLEENSIFGGISGSIFGGGSNATSSQDGEQ